MVVFILSMFTPLLLKSDLSSGDLQKSTARDWSELRAHGIESVADPHFELAYGKLWAEFGAKKELEQRETLARRFQWRPEQAQGNWAMLYQVMLLTLRDEFVAVRDQTAIATRVGEPQVVVHLSHALVSPEWRRTGVAGWLRALPLQTARQCLVRAGLPDAPISLVAEMEPWQSDDPARVARLKAYEKAGFKKVALPIAYAQPDFRSFEVIDATGGPQPVPLSLILRRVGREAETTVTAGEVRSIIQALYEMYAIEFRRRDMTNLFATLEHYSPAHTPLPLIAPCEPGH